MRTFVLFSLIALASAQNFGPNFGRNDICSSGLPVADGLCGGGEIPGTAGVDYPVFSQVPRTSFDCNNLGVPGYYADTESGCQAFYICGRQGKGDGFLCPNGTLFNQEVLVCDWWTHVDCSKAPSFYGINQQILAEMNAANERLGVNQRERDRLAQIDALNAGSQFAPISFNNPSDPNNLGINSPFRNPNNPFNPSNPFTTQRPFGSRFPIGQNQIPFRGSGQTTVNPFASNRFNGQGPFPPSQNGVPNQGQSPFGSPQRPFGVPQGQTFSPFGGPQSQTPFSRPQGTFGQTPGPFGLQNQTPNPFGQQGSTPSPFGPQGQTTGPFGQQNQTPSPFGQQGSTPSPFGPQGQTTGPFSQQGQKPSPFGQQNQTPSLIGQKESSPGPFGPQGQFPGPFSQNGPYGNQNNGGLFGQNQGLTPSKFGPTSSPFGNQGQTNSPFGPTTPLGGGATPVPFGPTQQQYPDGNQGGSQQTGLVPSTAGPTQSYPTTPVFDTNKNSFETGSPFVSTSTAVYDDDDSKGGNPSAPGYPGNQNGNPSGPGYPGNQNSNPSSPGYPGNQSFDQRFPTTSSSVKRPGYGGSNSNGGYQYNRPDREYLPPL